MEKKKQRCGDDLVVAAAKGGDLIKKILVRVPVKSLLRFKAVSKSWCALIESPTLFMDDDDLHTFNSSSNNHHHHQFGCFILLASFDILKEYSLFMISSSSESIDSVSRSSGGGGAPPGFTTTTHGSDNNHDDQEDDKLVFKVDNNNSGGGGGGEQQQLVFKLDNIGSLEYYGFCNFLSKRIIGSCNGLVCVRDLVCKEIYLWNPVTQQSKTLPKPLHFVEDDERYLAVLVAFGFDVETKDYKVMLLTGFKSRNHRSASPPVHFLCRVQVYNLSTDSWRVLEGIISLPGYPFFDSPPEVVCLNNASSCFFLAHYFRNKHELCFAKNDRLVISFDFTKEIFTPIELPEHDRHQKLYLSCLGDDKLALFTVSCKPSPRGDNYYPDIYELPPPPPSANYPEIYKPPHGIYYSEICGCQDFNIWVLDQHVIRSSGDGDGCVKKESWRQFRSFQIKHQTPGQWSSPTCISNDGEFALLETIYPWPRESAFGKKMKLYNLVTKEVKKDFLSCNTVMSKAYAYKPSLVSIIGGNGRAAAADSASNL